jgi:uncharacterized repeat protein (TIGR02543 family)
VKRFGKRVENLFNHGVVFYGVAAILLVVVVINTAMNRSSALDTYDMSDKSRSNSMLLTTRTIYTGDLTNESAQGFAYANKRLVVILTPFSGSGNMDNQRKNKLKLFEINGGSLIDRTESYGNPAIKMGHANSATYNSKTNELVVAVSSDFDEFKGQIVKVDASNFKDATTVTQVGAKSGAPVNLYGITYDKDLDRYYTYNSHYARYTDASTFKATNQASQPHLQVDQGMEYYNGFYYRVLTEAKGIWEGHPDKNGLYEKFDGVIFQFNSKTGVPTGAYYTKNPVCELEGMAIVGNRPYLLYNFCKDGKFDINHYEIAVVTNSDYDLQRYMYHQYDLLYDLDGGSWPNDDTSSHVASGYAGMDLKLTTVKPVRENYSFVGWKYGSKVYASGSTFVAQGFPTTVTLKAQWKEQTYTIKYNSNGGKNAPASETIGKTQDAIISNSVPTREYYTFKGWATTKGATEAEYAPGDTYTGRQNVTLYAVWQVKVYKVKFNANGGNGAPSMITSNMTDDVMLPSAVPTRNHYIFKGWSTDKDSDTVEYNPGDSYSSRKSATLYAIWEMRTYTIKFNANGGKNAPSDIVVPEVLGGIRLPMSTPSRTDYTFMGWSLVSGGGVEYVPGDEYREDRSATLYAVWQPNPSSIRTVTLTFDPNGGNDVPESIAVNLGMPVTIPNSTPIRDGYRFVKWASSPDGDNPVHYGGDSFLLYDDMALYAIWERDTITLNYDANGGSGAPASHSGQVGSIRVSSVVPVRDGYTFMGWSVHDENTVAYAPGQRFREENSMTLKAVWRGNSLSVRYFVLIHGAEGVTEQLFKEERVAPETTAKITSAVPVYGGFTFLGWSQSGNDVAVDYDGDDSIEIQNASIDLFAVWTSKKYVVSFDVNGSENDAPAQILNIGDPVIIPETHLEKAGYRFLGWSRDPDAITPEFVAGDAYIDAMDVILYAVWVPKGADDADVDDEDGDYNYGPDDFRPSGENAPVNPKTEAFDIFVVFPIMSGAFIAAGVLISRFKRR